MISTPDTNPYAIARCGIVAPWVSFLPWSSFRMFHILNSFASLRRRNFAMSAVKRRRYIRDLDWRLKGVFLVSRIIRLSWNLYKGITLERNLHSNLSCDSKLDKKEEFFEATTTSPSRYPHVGLVSNFKLFIAHTRVTEKNAEKDTGV
jgi:hypothetical protein